MGLVIFLLIVVGIIVLIVWKNKQKKEKEIEDLKNSKVYELAQKIKDELEKKGYDFGEPHINFIGNAYGDLTSVLRSGNYKFIHIYFSEYRGVLNLRKHNFRLEKISKGGRCYGIENANIGIMVYSDEVSQDMPEYIKIAAEVIKNSGYGSCTQIE